MSIIFRWTRIPSGYDKTLAQMTDEERTTRKKYESTDAMKEFAKWYRINKKCNNIEPNN